MDLADEGLEILDDDECLRLLATTAIGRVAISFGELAAVLPVRFALVGSDIVFFTGEGTKLDAARAGRMVSFEVDHFEPEGHDGWSVLVTGSCTLAAASLVARAEALGLYPWAAGNRHRLVRIRPDFLSGRRLLTGDPARPPDRPRGGTDRAAPDERSAAPAAPIGGKEATGTTT